MLSDFTEKKETFFYHFQKQSFSKTKKSHFSKGLTHAFNQTWLFFLYLQLIKKKNKRLEIILGDFAKKKKPFLL